MQILIPTPLRSYADGKAAVTVEAQTVAEALARLAEQHPRLRGHLFTEQGSLRSFVNVYLNEEDVRYLANKELSPVAGRDTLSIVPSIAGGR